MLNINKITKTVTYIGALDPELETFDIIMKTKYGSTYNSYLIDGGEEFALIDTAKEKYFDEYLDHLKSICSPEKIKYLIINHTEPDHSGEISKILNLYPHITIIGSPTAISFLKDIANKDFKSLEIKEGSSIKVGTKTIKFIPAPNLHWPDSMFTYLEDENLLFTCDVFGAHYHSNKIFADEIENKNNYDESFKYYFDCIFSPFKPFVISGIEKIKDLELNMICPSHGPVIRQDFEDYKCKYLTWSKLTDQIPGKIAICYTSAYGYTDRIAKEIKKGIEQEGFDVTLVDLLEKSIHEAVYEINSSEGFLIGSPTLNGDAVEPIWNLLLALNPYDNCSKLCAAFGSFGWSGEAVRNIESRLSMIKTEVFRPGLRIRFNPEEKTKLEKSYAFGENFAKKLLSTKRVCDNEWVEIKTGKWKCLVCGEIYEGEYPPEVCPACGAPQDQFIQISDDETKFENNTNNKYIIIGSGIAGITCAKEIRKRDKTGQIDIITNESELPYYRILLSKKLCIENSIEELVSKEWFENNNIKISFNTNVYKILPEKNSIILQNSTLIEYNKLIIAAGSSNNIIKIHGDDKKGVFNLRNKNDFNNISQYANKETTKEIVIIGGGILGVEMASSLKKIGKEITIIEYSPRIMNRQLDLESSQMIEKHLNQNKIKTYTSETVDEIYGTGENFSEVCGVKLAHSNKTIPCQMVIESTGIKANLNLIEDTKIEKNKGILVNKNMQTNYENIFACGDIAEFNNKNIGLWSIALEQAKVAAANVAGEKKEYIEQPISTSFNELGFKIFTIGDLGYNPSIDYQILELNDPKNKIYKKFYFKDNNFVGGILIGNTKKAIQLRKSLNNNSTIQHFLEKHFLDEEE